MNTPNVAACRTHSDWFSSYFQTVNILCFDISIVKTSYSPNRMMDEKQTCAVSVWQNKLQWVTVKITAHTTTHHHECLEKSCCTKWKYNHSRMNSSYHQPSALNNFQRKLSLNWCWRFIVDIIVSQFGNMLYCWSGVWAINTTWLNVCHMSNM